MSSKLWGVDKHPIFNCEILGSLSENGDPQCEARGSKYLMNCYNRGLSFAIYTAKVIPLVIWGHGGDTLMTGSMVLEGV